MDKDSINKRFIQAVSTLFRDKGLTKAGIAESLGLKPSKFSEILNNRMRAGTDTIAALCDKYSFSDGSRDNACTGRIKRQIQTKYSYSIFLY